MQELNNWDEETINFILHAAEIRFEEAYQLAADYVNESKKESGKTQRNELMKETAREYGRARGLEHIIELCNRMLRDNAEAVKEAQEFCHHYNYSTTLKDCEVHPDAQCLTRACDNCNAPTDHITPDA